MITTSADELKKIMRPKLDGTAEEFSSASFWHYTSLEAAEKILSNTKDSKPGFLVSNLERMNDLDELNIHSSESKKIFILCFCNTDKEKIPMWYMYSDIEGKGVSLGVTPGKMRTWIKNISIAHPFINGKIDFSKVLHRGVDFDLEVGKVAYRSIEESSNFRYCGTWYDHVTPEDDFKKDNYFIKLFPWYYEDEFRLVFKFKKECDFDRVFVPTEKTKFKVLFGPGFSEEDSEQKNQLSSNNLVASYDSSPLHIQMHLLKKYSKHI